MNINTYLNAILGVILVGVITYYHIKTTTLKLELTKAEQHSLVLSVNNDTLKQTITDNNKRLEELSTKMTQSKAQLAEWKAKPEQVKYETIYKYIPKYIDVKKDDCETTKSVINAVRNINFDEL